MIDIPTLYSPRLVLRQPTMDDFDEYCAFRQDPEQMKYLGGPESRETAFEKLAEIIGHWGLRGYGRFLVADKNTGQAFGIVGPYFPIGWPEPEIAWSLYRAAQGKGIAHEAAKIARKFAFDTLGWTHAVSMIGRGNTRSVALAKRLGCVQGDDFKHPKYGTLQTWVHPSAEAVA